MTELHSGDAPSTRIVGPITQTDIVRFAGAGGDFNPLHHDPGFVARTGFPGVIAMGQMHAAILAGFLTDWVGSESLRRFGVRFKAPVFVGDTLSFDATVDRVEDDIAYISLTVTRDGDTIMTAQAQAQSA